MPASEDGRHLGLWGATGVGVGAIVGGGILALSGVAFATAGPSAIIAFALNGAIAALTARSFADMSAAFPESGGTYTFAKKVLSVETAFMVGWVVWFASIVAAVLYALGFATFALPPAIRLFELASGGAAPSWLTSRATVVGLSLAATGFYARALVTRSAGGGQGATIGKVIVFGIVIAAGAIAFAGTPLEDSLKPMRPFFAGGGLGLVQAMGYTFIALQGFDLIAAVGGEVSDPVRNLPRSMFLSLGIALAIYMPLLFLVASVGTPAGSSIQELGRSDPEGVIALAAERFLGPVGWWLVMVAAILSMLSALQANLYGASRVALAMARDRTLPHGLATLRAGSATPARAVLATSGAVAAILLVIPSVAVAGAASSLIFLVSFAMVHWAAILVRMRRPARPARGRMRLARLAPAPLLGAAACVSLAVFQGFAVATAGALAAIWLAIGMALYLVRFAPRARVADASSQALDPELQRLRGLSPLVLVPIANPASAASLVSTASALAAPGVGRVLLLSVVKPPEDSEPEERERQLVDVQAVLGHSLHASFEGLLRPETLITVASEPWREIVRTARTHRCESLLLGLGRLDDEAMEGRVQRLMGSVDADVVVLRAPPGFRAGSVRRVLVPVGGRRDHSLLRARLLAGLWRGGAHEITLLRILPPTTPSDLRRRAVRELDELARDEVPGRAQTRVIVHDDPLEELARHAQEADLVILGIRREGRRAKVFGDLPVRLARRTTTPLLLLSRKR
jgi:amino acid transporter/nucleotide-binding universal stress UspA family protein